MDLDADRRSEIVGWACYFSNRVFPLASFSNRENLYWYHCRSLGDGGLQPL